MGWLAIPENMAGESWAWFLKVTEQHPGLAAWVQAMFTIIALVAAVIIPAAQHRYERKVEAQKRRERSTRIASFLQSDFLTLLMTAGLKNELFNGDLPICPPDKKRSEWLLETFCIEIPQRFWSLTPLMIDADADVVDPVAEFWMKAEMSNAYMHGYKKNVDKLDDKMWAATLRKVGYNLNETVKKGVAVWSMATRGARLPLTIRDEEQPT